MFIKDLIRAEVEAGKSHKKHLMQLLDRRLRRATEKGNINLISQLEAEWQELFPGFSWPNYD
jgi:hypothetical protein